jgi:hypothetical protein
MAAVTGGDGTTEPAPPGSASAADPSAPLVPPRVYRGELTSAVAAVLLLGLMFLTKWYGVAGVPDPSAARPAVSTAENAWGGLTIVRWVMLVTILAALGSVVLHASQRSHGTRTDTSVIVLTLAVLTSGLLVYRVLLNLPQGSKVIDQKLGAVLGVACAVGIALGAVESVSEQRRLQRAVRARPRHRRRLASGRRAR